MSLSSFKVLRVFAQMHPSTGIFYIFQKNKCTKECGPGPCLKFEAFSRGAGPWEREQGRLVWGSFWNCPRLASRGWGGGVPTQCWATRWRQSRDGAFLQPTRLWSCGKHQPMPSVSPRGSPTPPSVPSTIPADFPNPPDATQSGQTLGDHTTGRDGDRVSLCVAPSSLVGDTKGAPRPLPLCSLDASSCFRRGQPELRFGPVAAHESNRVTKCHRETPSSTQHVHGHSGVQRSKPGTEKQWGPGWLGRCSAPFCGLGLESEATWTPFTRRFLSLRSSSRQAVDPSASSVGWTWTPMTSRFLPGPARRVPLSSDVPASSTGFGKIGNFLPMTWHAMSGEEGGPAYSVAQKTHPT